MAQLPFSIVPGTDLEYVEAFEQLSAEGQFKFERATLEPFGEFDAATIRSRPDSLRFLNEQMRVIQELRFQFSGGLWAGISRRQDPQSNGTAGCLA